MFVMGSSLAAYNYYKTGYVASLCVALVELWYKEGLLFVLHLTMAGLRLQYGLHRLLDLLVLL